MGLLTVLMALTYLLGNASVVLWDRDEPRYAQTARQMLASGDWVVPRLLDEPREKKPAMIYWLQASAMVVLGPTAFAARLPSTIFVGVTVVLVGLALRRRVADETAVLTAAVFASSLMVIVAAKMAITDGVLLLFATAAQVALFSLLNGDRRWRMFALLGVAEGLALLTKGPVVPAITVITALSYGIVRKIPHSSHTQGEGEGEGASVLNLGNSKILTLSTRRRGIVLGLLMATALALAIFSPWWIAIEHRSPGWTYRVLHNEVLNRAATPQEGHKGPPGFYLLTIWGTFLPWSALLIPALRMAWKQRSEPAVAFALAAIIGPWILFEISATKLVHYLLPIYPALAYIVARWIVSRHWQRGAFATAIITMIIFSTIYAGIIPRIPELRVSKRLANALVADGATLPGQERMVDYKETSLAFYQGGTIRPESQNDFLIHTPSERWPQWLVISDAIWRRMPPEIRERWTHLQTIHGWNLAGKNADGKYEIDVHVLRKK